MKKLRWGRILFLIILVLLLLGGGYWGYNKFLNPNGKLPTGSALTLPPAPLTPENMTDKQKQDVIDQARRDAIAAALASGQTQTQANNFGDLAATAATNAMHRPLSVTTAADQK